MSYAETTKALARARLTQLEAEHDAGVHAWRWTGRVFIDEVGQAIEEDGCYCGARRVGRVRRQLNP